MDFHNAEDLYCESVANNSSNAQTFPEFVRESAPGPLAAALVLNGFIRRDFRLYSSAYPKEGRASVINYLTNHIQLNAMALDYKLSQQDCAEVVRLTSANCFTEPRGFNIYILQYLVKDNKALAKAVVESACATIHDEGGALLYLYFSAFDKKDWENSCVLGVMTSNLPDIFERIISSGLTKESNITEAFAFSLANIGTLKYETEGVGEWLLANWKSICFSSLSIDAVRSDLVCNLFKQSKFYPSKIAVFPEPLRHNLVTKGIYEITRENLLAASESTILMPLNTLMATYEYVFSRIAESNAGLSEYLECLQEDEPSLTEIREDILEALINTQGDNALTLAKTLQKASKDLLIDNIDLVFSLCSGNDIEAARALTSSAIQNELLRPSIHNIDSVINYCKANKIDPSSFAINQLLVANNVFSDSGQEQPLPSIQNIAMFVIDDSSITEKKALELIAKLSQREQEAFPLNLAEVPETSKRPNSFLLDLYEINAIGPLNEVLSKLKNASWEDKERCIAIVQNKGDEFPIELLDAEDYVNLIFSGALRGSSTWNTAMENAGCRLLELDASLDQTINTVIFFSENNLDVPNPLVEKLKASTLEWGQMKVLLGTDLPQSTKAMLLASSIAHYNTTELKEALKLMGAPYALIIDGSNSIPKLPNTNSDQKIAEASKEQLGSVVSSISLTSGCIAINKRKKKR